MSVTAPRGFLAAGVPAGLKASGRPDVGLLLSARPAAAAGLFTRNALPAAPVAVSREHLRVPTVRAVAVNSGQANAGTGEAGLADAQAGARRTADLLGAEPADVLVCSTGVIGPRIPMDRLREGLARAFLGISPHGGPRFARAILTTDTRPKETVVRGPGFSVGGCAKGAGMIAPDLATMLAFLTTDAEVEPAVLRRAVDRAVAPRFNAISVDGCTSTNDTVLVLANGASGVHLGPDRAAALEEALAEASDDLARQILLDAEGATKVLVAHVDGARSEDEARTTGKALVDSLLVKTALFGGDPNPGRLLQAVGSAGAALDPGTLSIRLAGQQVVSEGRMTAFDERACRDALKEREVAIAVHLGAGGAAATCFGCDLSYEYVRINAEYET